jgi:hypothetical protein
MMVARRPLLLLDEHFCQVGAEVHGVRACVCCPLPLPPQAAEAAGRRALPAALLPPLLPAPGG